MPVQVLESDYRDVRVNDTYRQPQEVIDLLVHSGLVAKILSDDGHEVRLTVSNPDDIGSPTQLRNGITLVRV
ncbi:MAG TPA: hypothetical protein VFG51_03765 [Candidatus Saccharimonadia bacterium]|nr:hypothetical protein [Candidatus Saccharimonadia bacterium]